VASRDIEKTENEKIFVEHQPSITAGELEEKLSVLRLALVENEPEAVREALRRGVPNYYCPEELNRQGSVVKVSAI